MAMLYHCVFIILLFYASFIPFVSTDELEWNLPTCLMYDVALCTVYNGLGGCNKLACRNTVLYSCYSAVLEEGGREGGRGGEGGRCEGGEREGGKGRDGR